MTLVDVLWLVGLIVAGVWIVVVLLARASQGRPERPLATYVAWSALGACAVSFVSTLANVGSDAALLWGLLAAPFAVPAARLFWWLGSRDEAIQEAAVAALPEGPLHHAAHGPPPPYG